MKSQEPVILALSGADIIAGMRHSPEWCPLALAGRELFTGSYKVEVTEEGLKVYYEDGRLDVYELSPAARQFIDFFDQGHPRKLMEEVYNGEEFHLTRKENLK